MCGVWQISFFFIFFFKPKTAYEVRISDWSSECALPILWWNSPWHLLIVTMILIMLDIQKSMADDFRRLPVFLYALHERLQVLEVRPVVRNLVEIGRASGRERVCQYV